MWAREGRGGTYAEDGKTKGVKVVPVDDVGREAQDDDGEEKLDASYDWHPDWGTRRGLIFHSSQILKDYCGKLRNLNSTFSSAGILNKQ